MRALGFSSLTRLGLVLGLVGCLQTAVAFAADPTPTESPGNDKPLQGKGFDIGKFENSLWTPEKRRSEITKSEARKRKIESLKSLIADPT